MLLLPGCELFSPDDGDEEPLRDTRWELVQYRTAGADWIDVAPRPPLGDGPYTLAFGAEGADTEGQPLPEAEGDGFRGSTGCNGMWGWYQTAGRRDLRIGTDMAVSLALCPYAQLDPDFIGWVRDLATFRRHRDTLWLTTRDGEVELRVHRLE